MACFYCNIYCLTFVIKPVIVMLKHFLSHLLNNCKFKNTLLILNEVY